MDARGRPAARGRDARGRPGRRCARGPGRFDRGSRARMCAEIRAAPN